MKIYISSSWKNREQVRAMAVSLRDNGHEVYDFTDPNCRKTCEIPPESYPEQFDPKRHHYPTYLDNPDWRMAVNENRKSLQWCDAVLLLLPCGIDSTADWALAVGMGKTSIVIGHPKAGERSPVHLWADDMVDDIDEAIDWVNENSD